MRNKSLSWLLLFLTMFTTMLKAQQNQDTSFDIRLKKLLDEKEYFRLEKQLNLLKDSIGNKQRLYFQCFLDNAFNRNTGSTAVVDELQQQYSATLPDSMKASLLLLRAGSWFRQFQYAKAANDDSIVIVKYASVLNNEQLSDVKNDLLIANALRNIPPQETIINNSDTIKWKKSNLGLIEIPVQFNGEHYSCVLDTKANISCISETYATKLKLKILDGTCETGSDITGIKFKTGLAVADSIYIGNVLVKNAVFLVLPDAKLRFFIFSIHVIIGFPIIEQLQELQLYNNGTIIIPKVPVKSELHNFALDGFNPVACLTTGNDTLCFHIDLGATETKLYSRYFERYKDTIITLGKPKNRKVAGAGGSTKKQVYLIPQLDLSIGNKTGSLKNIKVFTQKLNQQERFYGNLGRDFASKFDVLIFNFKYMYLKGSTP